MKFPFRQVTAGSIAAVGLASAMIHPFGDIKGPGSGKFPISGVSSDTAVLQVLERSCQSCHSQQTQWPWYSYIAPVSWMIENDVRNGRNHMNLSRWSEYSDDDKRAMLASVGAAVRSKAMPLPRYLRLHPEAKLSAAEIERIYQWTKNERRRL